MITPSDKQAAVLGEVEAWLADPSGPQWKYLAGYAGTGKTTIAQLLSQERSVLFCAYTGKAANVLREKGCANATTLHRAIYRPEEKVLRTEQGEVRYAAEFVARDDEPLAPFDLVVLDECSMVDSRMAVDLLSQGKRVLVQGDPFQLPPVSGEGYFTKGQPDWLLTEVHRQAADSGILRLATDVREGRGVLDPASYAPDAAVVSMDEAMAHEQELLDWCQIVLVGTHRYRRHFNRQYRERSKIASAYPVRGEQLVCLQNDHKRGLLNGSIWNVEADAIQSGHMKLDILISSDDDPEQKLLAECWAHDFLEQEDKLNGMAWKARASRARFTYGYALTVHKAQGSEFARVLAIDESSTFRESAAQWLYTAITRAAKQLVLVRR